MPQMMPIWWVIMLMITSLFFLCFNTILFYFPLFNLLMDSKKIHENEKLIDLSKYDL